MIKIFSDINEAQKLCDTIHKFLSDNCPNYSASCWQFPVKAIKSELYYVQIPKEYDLKDEPIEKQLYQSKESISIALATSFTKAVQTVEKLPDDFKEVTEVT